ncbi:5550_t:CDS:2, partial [Dentiscutata heterogama]
SLSTIWAIFAQFGIAEGTPQGDYKKEVFEEFQKMQGFPLIIGAIDSLYIPFFEASSRINKDVYFSRKHQYGIYLQRIVDYKVLFINYDIGWPASVHDAKTTTTTQINYNIKHSKTRVVVEQVFGHLKARFIFLKAIKISDPPNGVKIIEAALILHNFIGKNRDIWRETEYNDDAIEIQPEEDSELVD